MFHVAATVRCSGAWQEAQELNKLPHANDTSLFMPMPMPMSMPMLTNNRSIMTMIDFPISVMFMGKTKEMRGWKTGGEKARTTEHNWI